MTTDFVLGFIRDKADKRIGMRVYNITTEKVSEVSVPENCQFLNLYIREGRLTPHGCRITDFPVFTGGTVRAYFRSAKGANAWVLGKYDDGRLRLVSVTGQVKTVTYATALVFHTQYGIVGCLVSSKDGSLLPSPTDYISLRVSNNVETMDKEGARALLTLKYDLDTDMKMVLLDACQIGDLELVNLVVSSELVDIHTDTDKALRLASSNGHKEVVELLLNNGADIHAYTDDALKWASHIGHTGVVGLLLSRGANIHADNEFALRYASMNGHTDVVEVLINSGANIHIDKDYPLRIAREKGHKAILELLTKYV